MKVSIKKHSFIIFWICLMISTYISISEELIIASSILFFLISKKAKSKLSINNSIIVIFLVYYLLVTIGGVILGNVEVMSVAKYIVQFFILYYCIKTAISFDESGGSTLLCDLRNLICISAIYGTIETIFRYNIIGKYVKSVDWLSYMNTMTIKYQPSSIYLHYTYYAFFLLAGFIILLRFPFENTCINIFAHILILEQLFLSKSRMGWITFIIILFVNLIRFLNNKKIKKRYLYLFLSFILIFLLLIFIKPGLINKVYLAVVNRFSAFIKHGMKDGSIGQRFGTLINYPKYLMKYPLLAIFGTGYDSMENVYLSEYSYFVGYNTADNYYLSIMIESGIIGFLLFIMAICLYIKKNIHQNNKIGVVCKQMFLLFALQGLTYGLNSYFQFAIILLIYCLWKYDSNINIDLD